jgi:hypothetical protein
MYEMKISLDSINGRVDIMNEYISKTEYTAIQTVHKIKCYVLVSKCCRLGLRVLAFTGQRTGS